MGVSATAEQVFHFGNFVTRDSIVNITFTANIRLEQQDSRMKCSLTCGITR